MCSVFYMFQCVRAVYSTLWRMGGHACEPEIPDPANGCQRCQMCLFLFVMAPLQRGWVRVFSFLNSPIFYSSNSCMLRFYPRNWVHFVWIGTGHDRGAECPAAALSEGNPRAPPEHTNPVRFGSVRSVSQGVIRRFMVALKVPVAQFDCCGLVIASH